MTTQPLPITTKTIAAFVIAVGLAACGATPVEGGTGVESASAGTESNAAAERESAALLSM